MDLDNGPTDGSGGGGLDIDQSLLQQFSCMGTTDRDELVQQFQKILGSHLNYTTASFFLSMNNWNLQAAICSYFDVENSQKLPSMALVSDPRASETESVEPSISFQKTWNVYNNGNEAWPVGCYLQCADGDRLGASRKVVPALQPGEGTCISVEMTSPASPGMYQSKWRLCTPLGTYFGDKCTTKKEQNERKINKNSCSKPVEYRPLLLYPMWAIITVFEEGTMAITQQLSHLSELGALPASVPANPFMSHRIPPDHFQGESPPDTDSNMC